MRTTINLILYLFHEDYIQPEATSSSPQHIEYVVAPSDKVPNNIVFLMYLMY